MQIRIHYIIEFTCIQAVEDTQSETLENGISKLFSNSWSYMCITIVKIKILIQHKILSIYKKSK